MRVINFPAPLVLSCLALSLSGCSLLPRHDPNQAWIDLDAGHDNSLKAVQVDEKNWQDTRYFQVTPGSHELTVRFQFPVQPSNIGPVAEPLWRDCEMRLQFADFDAGQRYRLQAGSAGFSPWAKLYDEQQRVVGQGQSKGCQHA